jgi:hypothetical protein
VHELEARLTHMEEAIREEVSEEMEQVLKDQEQDFKARLATEVRHFVSW